MSPTLLTNDYNAGIIKPHPTISTLYREGVLQHLKCKNDKVPNLPNIHTSLAEVKRRKFMDSGAIHLIGSFPLEALEKSSQFASHNV